MTSIVKTYNELLRTDPFLTHPIAAIEALISLLAASPVDTISETLSLLSTATIALKSSVSNPVALSAGTDLFQRYIISTLQQRSSQDAKGRSRRNPAGGAEDFRAVRAHLLANSRLFVQRAKEARGKIASVMRKFVRDGSTVLTCGRSRVVAAVLEAAADENVRFQVIYAEDSLPSSPNPINVVNDLRRKDIPVAVIPFAAMATALSRADFILAGAESVVENGGVISSMGTYQMGLLAKSKGRPFYVVAESHKFVRVFPLDGGDLPIKGMGIEFSIENEEGKGMHEEGRRKERDLGVDFTPPELITAIVTENGVQTPSAVSEELIKIWY